MKAGRRIPKCFILWATVALLAALGASRVYAELSIHIIDVGQADACLIISPAGGTMLIDAGDNGDGSSIVVPYLQNYGFQALDYIVATHYHADHIGGIDEVVSYLGIDSVRVSVYDRGWSYTSVRTACAEMMIMTTQATAEARRSNDARNRAIAWCVVSFRSSMSLA